MNKELNFRYRMLLQFDSEITGHHYTLKCLPESNLRQHITALDIKLLPAGLHWESRDAFGNRELLGVLLEKHDHFSAEISGEVQLLLGTMSSNPAAGPCLTLPDGTSLYAELPVREEKLGIYRYPTELTRPGKHITEWLADFEAENETAGSYGGTAQTAESISSAGTGTAQTAGSYGGTAQTAESISSAKTGTAQTAGSLRFADDDAFTSSAARAVWAVRVMHSLHRYFVYRKAATDVSTSAEEAMEKGAGVCQDYAHIFLSLLRLRGIPARYVTGMLQGEGESHAWVEVALGDFWYGLDPTNDCAVAGEHVRIACGRDYRDCRISQGVFYGGARQSQKVEALVYTKESEENSTS